MMHQRSDVKIFPLTKRPQRAKDCLPPDRGDSRENVFFNVTRENWHRADKRIPILLELPFKHKGIMCAPFIGAVSIEKYLADGQIEQVICGSENYDGARPCNFDGLKICVMNVKHTILLSALLKLVLISSKTENRIIFRKSRCKAKWHSNPT